VGVALPDSGAALIVAVILPKFPQRRRLLHPGPGTVVDGLRRYERWRFRLDSHDGPATNHEIARRIHPHSSSCRCCLRYHSSMPTRTTDARMYPTLTRAEANAWRHLHRQLAKTRTLQDAKKVAAQAPPPHAKRFYEHLRSFVRTLRPPRHGTRSELYVYRKLRLRFAPTRRQQAAGR